jgi:DNA-binding sugar fermentation-stimulating protein
VKLEKELQEATILRRLNRFAVAVRVDGVEMVAYLPNSGRAVVFVIQRPDAYAFSPCVPCDLAFATLLSEAAAVGVGVYAYRCRVSEREMSIEAPVPVEL